MDLLFIDHSRFFSAGSSTVNGINTVAGTHTTPSGNGTALAPLMIDVQWPTLVAGTGVTLTGDGEPDNPYTIGAINGGQGITFVSAIDGTHSTVVGLGIPSDPLQVNVTWPTLTGSSGIVTTPNANGYDITGTTDTNPIANSVVVYTDVSGDRGTPTAPVTSSQPLDVTFSGTTTLANPLILATASATVTTGNVFAGVLSGDASASSVLLTLENTSATSMGTGIVFGPANPADQFQLGNDSTASGSDDFYLNAGAINLQLWTPTLVTIPVDFQTKTIASAAIVSSATVTATGLTLSTEADNPGGASTIWWTDPATRPNFGDNGPLALLSDVTGGGGGGTVVNPIANELVVFASSVVSPFELESAATTATLHQPLTLTNPTVSTPSFTIIDGSGTNTPQIKIVSAASAPTLGCSFGINAQNNGSAIYFNGDISSGTGYNAAAYRWGLVESNATSLATSNLYVEFANGSTFTTAQMWTSSLITLSLPVSATSPVTTPSVILTTLGASPGGSVSALWWTSPSTRPNFGTSGQLALLSDISGGGGTVTNPIANELVVFSSNVVSPFALKSASAPVTLGQPITISGTTTTTGVTLSTSATDPGGASTIWWTSPATRPNFGTAGVLALVSDVPVATNAPTANELVVFASSTQTPFSVMKATTTATLGQSLTVTGSVSATSLVSSTTVTGTGLTLNTSATDPGGVSTLWWTTPSTRPNFGTAGVLALVSDVPVATNAPTTNEVVVFASATQTPFSVMKATTTATLGQPLSVTGTITASSTVATTGLALTSVATDPGAGASTIWWTTPSTRPNFGANGAMALLSDITGGGIVTTNVTVDLTTPTQSPWATPPTTASMTLTKYTVGTHAFVVGEVVSLQANATAGNISNILYGSGTVPAAFVPASIVSIPVMLLVQSAQFAACFQITSAGVIQIPALINVSTLPTVTPVSWGTGLAGILQQSAFSYPIS